MCACQLFPFWSLYNILDIYIDLVDLHAHDMFQRGGDFLLNSGTYIDDVGARFYDQIEISRDDIVSDGQGNALPGYLASQPACPLVGGTGHTYHA